MAGLIGIARMAAESATLEAKRRVEYFELETRRFIGRCSSARMPFAWTVNPYRGCEFGCKYCYARYTHEFMELRDPGAFERKIFAKRFTAAAFREELRRVPRKDSIWIGTATDPYQPAERRFGVTRGMLEVIAEGGGRRLGLTTKSDLVGRDADLLGAIARRNAVNVHVSVTTLDEDLARQLEPFAPRPALRLAAIETLTRAGVPVTVLCAPVLPLINDREASLEAICAAGAAAGATSFHASALFLRSPSKEVFLRFIDERFPQLARRYRERYERAAYLSGAYPETLRARVAAVRARQGMARRTREAAPPEWPGGGQMRLFE